MTEYLKSLHYHSFTVHEKATLESGRQEPPLLPKIKQVWKISLQYLSPAHQGLHTGVSCSLEFAHLAPEAEVREKHALVGALISQFSPENRSRSGERGGETTTTQLPVLLSRSLPGLAWLLPVCVYMSALAATP